MVITENELKKLKRESRQAFVKYQKATQEYHWTERDDGAKWNRVVALQKADEVAFHKYAAALKAFRSGK